MARQNDDMTVERVTRMIDMRIPLPYLLSGALTIALTLAGMYYSLQQLQRDMADVKMILKTSDAVSQAVVQKQAVHEFRIQTLENDVAQIKGARR